MSNCLLDCCLLDCCLLDCCLLDCFFSDRHTSENLAEELLRVAREWQVVDGKGVCCVSNNAANITEAMNTF
jgi:hypothetical protein